MKEALESLGLPPDAVRWLLGVWLTIQTWDDVADGDKIEREDLDRAIFLTMAPIDLFFEANKAMLLPLMANAVLKWKASDTIERERMTEHLPKAYMWRAGFYDVVLQVLAICKGEDFAMSNAHRVAMIYGEKLEDYMKEFDNA